MKTIRAVAPYAFSGKDNFKAPVFRAWRQLGGGTAPAHYPPRLFHRLAFGHDAPSLFHGDEARLRFVEPVSISFDTFPDQAFREVVPMVWDCWPMYFERVCAWLSRHRVRTAIFTSSQTAERMRRRFPDMNVLYVPEGIDTTLYGEGKPLAERRIGVLEIGSVKRSWYKKRHPADYGRLGQLPTDVELQTAKGFRHALGDARLTVICPRCYTQPEDAGDIETLTQRYWEAMLSRMVMVGRAPRDLTDLLGYNPVIELDTDHPTQQLENMLAHIADYQPLADRNRQAALQHGDWRLRVQAIMQFLEQHDYQCKNV